jgi:hypothetical protein
MKSLGRSCAKQGNELARMTRQDAMPFFNDFGGPTVYKIEQFLDKPFE